MIQYPKMKHTYRGAKTGLRFYKCFYQRSAFFFIDMELDKGRKALNILQTLWQNSVVWIQFTVTPSDILLEIAALGVSSIETISGLIFK